jgi:hypothetical protein
MNYSNYEDIIMQGRKVKIIGWPASVAFASPSTIGNLKDMRTLHDGWMAGTIRWIRMTTVEVKEHAADLERRRDEGEMIGKKRKRRTQKKRKPKTSKRSDDDDESSIHSEVENNPPSKSTKTPKRSKRTHLAQMPPKSREVISDSDEGDEADGMHSE